MLPSRNESGQANRKLYFINEIVEWKLTRYIWTGCTDVTLRDSILSHVSELIRQIIRKQGLHTIYPGQDDSSFSDLVHVAICQIERVLYKYRSRPHCRNCFNPDRPSDSILYDPGEREYGIKTVEETIRLHRGKCPKCDSKLLKVPMVEPYQGCYGGTTTILYRGTSKVFNLWSQVSRTVILAHIKKEGRDKKNSSSYISHMVDRPRQPADMIHRFISELRDITSCNDTHTAIVNALEWLIHNDDRPHDGIVCKLVERTGLSRIVVTDFLRLVRLRSLDFTDSPINKATGRRGQRVGDDDDDDDDYNPIDFG